MPPNERNPIGFQQLPLLAKIRSLPSKTDSLSMSEQYTFYPLKQTLFDNKDFKKMYLLAHAAALEEAIAISILFLYVI